MSDFLTRLVERQAGRIATIQPRIPSMFVSSMTPRNMPTPPPSPDSALHPAGEGEPEREKDRLPAPSARVERLKARPVPPTAPTASLSFPAGASDLGRPSARPTLNGPDEQSPTMDGANVPTPRSSHRRAAQPQPVANQPTPMSIAAQSGRLNHADPPPGENVEPPPRLVELRIETRGQLVAAPPSLVSTGILGKGFERIPQGETEPSPVQVSIGRIEVTAVTSPPVPKRKPAPRQPSMSLQDYLSRRKGRGA